MVSEDSDQFGSGQLPVHRLRDLEEVSETSVLDVSPRSHELETHRELLEIEPLRRSEGMHLEKRDDHLGELRDPADRVPEQVLSVVVVPAVPVYVSHLEEGLQLPKDLDAFGALDH